MKQCDSPNPTQSWFVSRMASFTEQLSRRNESHVATKSNSVQIFFTRYFTHHLFHFIFLLLESVTECNVVLLTRSRPSLKITLLRCLIITQTTQTVQPCFKWMKAIWDLFQTSQGNKVACHGLNVRTVLVLRWSLRKGGGSGWVHLLSHVKFCSSY